ncbi:GTPase HflX [Granulosicoccaceae sp. 1_MG-2023]|nr:GTPase HflX [Granulosicoccaceae sp. 1_MG-2023]
MFERPSTGERALLVHIDQPGNTGSDDEIREFRELSESAGATVLDLICGVRARPDPKYYAGSGKVDEIADAVHTLGAELVIFNQPLSPSQERNLEKRFSCRVLDRNGLILDIFAQRASTFEGKLQVELAQLVHLSTRLVRGWTHLERQKGGIGLRGPGETQLETDRRLLGVRVKAIRARLAKVRRQREQGRQSRKRSEVPVVSLVGYTNAGKSTLFNTLTGNQVYAADQLFATLDPTFRRLELAGGREVILVDTVGFISNLPHELVDAFQSTLLETREADLLLHVVDAADEARDQRMRDVDGVLAEIGAEDNPALLVYNKVDKLGTAPHVDRDADGKPVRVWLSAMHGEGLDLLREAIAERVDNVRVHGWLRLQPDEGQVRARLFEGGAVITEEYGDDGSIRLEVDTDKTDWVRLCKRFGLDETRLSLIA